MHVNGAILMKLFGMKDPLKRVLDSYKQDKDGVLKKTIYVSILKVTELLLLYVQWIIIILMLLPGIILVLLEMLRYYVSTALENLKPLRYGLETKKN